MSKSTPEQRAEWNELRRQIDAAVKRMNAIAVETGYRYRVRCTQRVVHVVSDDEFPWEDDGSDGELVGSERAEREDREE
jgi:hypothetical protein